MLISFMTSSVWAWFPKPMVRLGVGLIRSGRAQVFLSVKPWPGLPLPDARGGHEVSVEVVRKAVEFLRYTIVAAYQRVVAEHCGTRHGQAQRRHDQRLADQAGHLVGGCLAGCADGQQRGRCPRPAEHADERRGRIDRDEDGQAGRTLDERIISSVETFFCPRWALSN